VAAARQGEATEDPSMAPLPREEDIELAATIAVGSKWPDRFGYLYLHEVHGMTYKAIADLLELTEHYIRREVERFKHDVKLEVDRLRGGSS
jgi:DNA-directed RNA polymerase specialized sigma24 family protein